MTHKEYPIPGRAPIYQFDALDSEGRMRREWETAMIESRAEFYRSLGIQPVLKPNRTTSGQHRTRSGQHQTESILNYASYDGRRPN